MDDPLCIIHSIIKYDGVCFSCDDVVITNVVDIEENIWSPRFVVIQYLSPVTHRKIFLRFL